MKILKHILPACLLCCGVAAALTACSSDDDLTGYVPTAPTIEIQENNLTFPAQCSTATLSVGTNVSVELNASWCTATVNGSVVTVTAEPNASFEGRTALLTLTAGDARRQLPVQQLGMVLGTMPVSSRSVSMAGEAFTYNIPHDLPMTVTATESWLHADLDGERLTITADANNEGHLRRGLIITESTGYRDTLSLVQYDLHQDVVGSYYILGYYGSNAEQPAATRFDVVERNDSLFMHFSSDTGRYDDTYIYVPFNSETCTLTFLSAFTLYQKGNTADTGYFYDTNNYICTSRFAGVNCTLYYSGATGVNVGQLSTYNWPGHTIDGFIIRSVSIVTSTLIQLSHIVITRVGPVGTSLSN